MNGSYARSSMNLKEAVERLSKLEHKLAVVRFLQAQLEEVLPNDAGFRVKEPLKAREGRGAVPDDAVYDILDVLDELSSSFDKEISLIEKMEFSDGRKAKK